MNVLQKLLFPNWFMSFFVDREDASNQGSLAYGTCSFADGTCLFVVIIMVCSFSMNL